MPTCEDTCHIRSSLSSFPGPKAHFLIVHVDLVGPLPSSWGFSYLLTWIDHFTWWPEAIPITNTTTETVIQAFLYGWVSWYSVPSTTVTDCGCQFESHLWTNLISFLKFKRACTTAYHPQSNRMVEHFHRQLKCALKAQTNTDLWMEVLPLVLLGIQTALKEDISSTAAEWCMHNSPLTWRILHSYHNYNYHTQLKAHMQRIHSSPPR